MTEKPFLEIVMPTRNRLAALQVNLPDILSQIQESDAIISFFDNASTDGTKEYLSELLANSPKVRYTRNNTNIGLDRNMLLGLEHSVGRYVFWLGDDDALRPDALRVIETTLKSHNPHLLLLQMIFSPDAWSYDSQSDSFHEQPDRFFDLCCYLMPFGAQVFNTDMAKKSLSNAYRFVGTYHAYAGLLFDALAETYREEGKVSILRHGASLVKCSGVPKAWAADKSEMYFSGLPRWFDLLDSIYAELATTKRSEYTNWPDYLDLLESSSIKECDPLTLTIRLQEKIHDLRKAVDAAQHRSEVLSERLTASLKRRNIIQWLFLPSKRPEWFKNPLNTVR